METENQNLVGKLVIAVWKDAQTIVDDQTEQEIAALTLVKTITHGRLLRITEELIVVAGSEIPPGEHSNEGHFADVTVIPVSWLLSIQWLQIKEEVEDEISVVAEKTKG